ncbi:hypothetical protein PIB30_056497 [Stylosanthes scabra]|uniref:Uncharacterized protein n=1 Tax=Stylosanthes scabra TaxID=79078 RepID=A0ABU6VLD6_9FABA|nr:hypothetical protein [Stylosanthes scabra]
MNFSIHRWQAREKHHPLESAGQPLNNNLCSKSNCMKPPLMRKELRSLRRALHERTIKFPKEEDTFEERILARGWGFMYEPSIPINLSWVWEFYANRAKKDQREIFLRGKKISCSVSTIEKILNIPKFKGKYGYSEISVAYNKNALNMDDVLKVIVMSYAMNTDPTKTKTHLLIFPMFITKWARENNVPRLPGDWHEDDEEVAPPVPPPAAPADIPAPSAPSSPEPSRKDLMRELRHEQLMLMLHPGLDTSRLEQIFSPEISQNQQDQRAGSAEKGNTEEDEDFQIAEATRDANTYVGEESAEEE